MIVGQYRGVVGALDDMFKFSLGPRLAFEVWRQDGSGSCRRVSKKDSQQGLIGVARKKLIDLREERNASVSPPGRLALSLCPYHRANYGCVLGDFKSSVCIAQVDVQRELKDKFRVNGAQFMQDIEDILRKILLPRTLRGALKNEEFVADAKGAVAVMSKYFETFPPIWPIPHKL